MIRLATGVALLLAACNAPRAEGQVPPGLVEVLESSAVIKTGPIGIKEKKDATYVLVDVRNVSAEERTVSVQGTLLDDGGKPIGPLSLDELVIPPGELRTFALLHGGVAPNASRASFQVRRAAPVDHPPPIRVLDPVTEKDGDALGAICRVENTLDRTAIVTVIATFYDAGGKILGRPFVLLELEPRSSRPFRFTGPVGSTTARLFIGQTSY
jgi:hypothetical protein